MSPIRAAVPFDYNGNGNGNRIRTGGLDVVTSLLGLEHTGSDATSNSVKYIKTPDGSTLGTTGTTSNPNSAYFLRDNIGSIVGLVSATGNKTAAYSYDPYGITRTATGTAATTNPLRYTGGFRDAATGLYKFGFRYYDPSTGRFTQQDPSGKESNAYQYAGSDPVNNADPDGLDYVAVTLGPKVLNAIAIVLATATSIATVALALTGVGLSAEWCFWPDTPM